MEDACGDDDVRFFGGSHHCVQTQYIMLLLVVDLAA